MYSLINMQIKMSSHLILVFDQEHLEELFLDLGVGGDLFQTLSRVSEILFIPHWQPFLINIINAIKSLFPLNI